MESHVLNSYHQARYRISGHNRAGSTSESYSSESSGLPNSPEYTAKYNAQVYQQCNGWKDHVTKDEIVDAESNSENEYETEVIDNEHRHVIRDINGQEILYDSDDDYEVVVDEDAPLIQVYAVDPNLDLEGSDDDDFRIAENEEELNDSKDDSNEINNDLGINFDVPVVTNIDEYFVKNSSKDNIHEDQIKGEVPNVNEYFISHEASCDDKDSTAIPNVDDFFVKTKPESEQFTNNNVPNVDDFFNKAEDDNDASGSDNEDEDSYIDSGSLPRIEQIKKFLLEDMPTPNTHNKSCSLPHSPAHFSCLDLDEAKTCLSFEDLNLDLSDFNFSDAKSQKSSTTPTKVKDESPRALTEEDINSFLLSNKTSETTKDDFNEEDMEIEKSVEAKIDVLVEPQENYTPKSSVVLDFCIEKASPIKSVRKGKEIKVETEDFVDVESINDPVVPVIEANNVSSLLEQFEASEKINTSVKKSTQLANHGKNTGLANGMRLQDAAAMLNKNRIRHILMSSSTNTVSKSQTVHSDHDYCSPKKKNSTALKRGQSLLKPEVLSSNNKILNSRHRSCKSKKVVYHLSSDEESDYTNNKSAKPSVKTPLVSNHRKKLSQVNRSPIVSCKENVTVISKNASKASDNLSQSSNGSIKLTIKNKSKVILKMDCDDKKDSQKTCIKNEENPNKNKLKVEQITKLIEPNINQVVTMHQYHPTHNDTVNINKSIIPNETKIELPSDNLYTGLIKNESEIQIVLPQSETCKNESNSDSINIDQETDQTVEAKPQKRKLNLQEYKLRREAGGSNNNSRTVSPEAIFPELQLTHSKTDDNKHVLLNNNVLQVMNPDLDANKKVFDPIREASRKILANTKKQKAEALRKRDEDIVMSKIPKVDNLELQPLISDAEMLKIVGMATNNGIPVPIGLEKQLLSEKQKLSDYQEIILVSIGTNTSEDDFNILESLNEKEMPKSVSPTEKSTINFNIKKKNTEVLSKKNVFDTYKKEKSANMEHRREKSESPNHNEKKIDEHRFKDITATLKSVEKQVDTKISSNSLFASIQDVIKKNAPEGKKNKETNTKLKSMKEMNPLVYKSTLKTVIIRDYDSKLEHGEDKIILHLEKNRQKPNTNEIALQTIDVKNDKKTKEEPQLLLLNGNQSNISTKIINEDCLKQDIKKEVDDTKCEDIRSKERIRRSTEKQYVKERYRSKSRSSYYRSRRSKRSRSHSVSRKRRSASHHKRRRSRSPSHYRSRSRRTPSKNRKSYSTKSRTPPRSKKSPIRKQDFPSKSYENKSKTVSPIKCKSPELKLKPVQLETPVRKPTVSESSDSSSSTSSSSSSNLSRSRSRSVKRSRSKSRVFRSRSKSKERRSNSKGRRSRSKGRKSESRSSRSSSSSRSRSRSKTRSRSNKSRSRGLPSSSSYKRNSRFVDNGDGIAPVEERRIVFVGKLATDITKYQLKSQFIKFGPIHEVTLHTKDDGCRYGFVTFKHASDAWSAVEAAHSFPQYDVGFGGRRAFCRRRYADLDGLEAECSESAYHGSTVLPILRNDDMPFEQMLLEMKKKLNQRKNEKQKNEEEP